MLQTEPTRYTLIFGDIQREDGLALISDLGYIVPASRITIFCKVSSYMEPIPETDPAFEEVFSEQAIEDAYLQALQASEEAGLISSVETSLAEMDSQNEEVEREPTDPFRDSATESVTASAAESTTDEVESAVGTISKPGFTPEQIIEAILVVGGEKLSARKLSKILGSHSKEEAVRDWIDQINSRYASQNRPYEIQLGEDGYQLVLKPEFHTQRNLVFGIGPREVKLSQDATEVLSFIAYKQPVTKKELQEIDNPNVLTALRQLIRRELVAISRPEESAEPQYHVTDRFLRLFGLNSLDELPRAEELSFK